MVSINTNLSSSIVQNSLRQSTNGLNKAIERLTTGYKINHAQDNAANYSIANNMASQLSSYDVAAQNVSMGLDLLAVAQDTISSMQDHGSRLHALITQARNGTYGNQSIQALTQEATALVSEIQRMYSCAEYNGISLFDNIQLPDWAEEVKANAGVNLTPKANGFIDDIETVTPDVVVTEASALSDAISNNTKIGIANAEVLAELATLVNSGTTCSGKTIILTDDIDLSAYQAGEGWNPIGNSFNSFNGTFDGQGHVVKNLKINRESTNYQGLFGYAGYGSTIKNVGVVGCNVKGKNNIGGLVGFSSNRVDNCYSTGSVMGKNYTGGLIGETYDSSVINCYSTCDVTGTGERTGGLIGNLRGNTTNCYATGNVNGNGNYTGGFAGLAVVSEITNCYSTGSVTGMAKTGGFVGYTNGGSISSCYSTGSVSGSDEVGGFVGNATGAIMNSYSTGAVRGTDWVGGFIGQIDNTLGTLNLDKLCSIGNVNGSDKTGSLIGGMIVSSNGRTFGTVNITNASTVSNGLDLIGYEGSSIYDRYTYTYNYVACESGQMDDWLSNITVTERPSTTLQVGINGDNSSQINFETSFNYDLSAILSDIRSDGAYNAINSFMNSLSEKATEIGAVSNRLQSSLDSIQVKMENLTSSLSTIKDADVAQVSSEYIRQQILQQASATLLSTANQAPSIALQLL